MAPSVNYSRFARSIADALDSLDKLNAKFPGIARGTLRGTVADVDDPEERGRVRVIFDAFNPEARPQFEGAGEYSLPRDGEPGLSHWIDVSPAFKGKQPPGLVGKRVNIVISNGQHPYAILQDVIFDPQVLTDSAASKLELPNNSSMTRLPVYPAGKLPPPDKFNLGCMVIEEGGPMNSDWVCVCLKRDGKHIWVRHGDLAHGHAGGNDVTSQVTSSGDRTNPGQVAASWDHVFPTSHQEMQKYTAFFTGPAGNPFGSLAKWNPPPMATDIKPLPFKTGELFNQSDALSFVRKEAGFTQSIPGSFISKYAPNIPAAVPAIPGVNFALKALSVGQKAAAVVNTVQGALSDPTQFVTQTALAALKDPPAATQQVLSGLQNPQGFITTVFSSFKQAIGL